MYFALALIIVWLLSIGIDRINRITELEIPRLKEVAYRKEIEKYGPEAYKSGYMINGVFKPEEYHREQAMAMAQYIIDNKVNKECLTAEQLESLREKLIQDYLQ